MKRRAISFLIVLALCLSLCPMRVLAADDEYPSSMMTSGINEDTNRTTTKVIDGALLFDTKGYSFTVSAGPAVRVPDSAALYLTRGTIESTVGTGIEVQSGGFLRVNDPDMTVTGKTYGLDIASGAEVRLSGGTFRGGTAAIQAAGGDYAALLKDGYAYFDADNNPIALNDMDGQKTVVVNAHTGHEYDYTPDAYVPDADVTHSGICKYCGKSTPGPEMCTFSFGESNSAKCDYCDHTITVTITPGDLTYDKADKADSVTVTVKLDGSEISSSGYSVTVEPPSPSDVGDFTVTVKGESYNGTYRETFRITQAQPVIAWQSSDAVQADYTGSPVEKTVLPDVTITPSHAASLSGLLYYSYREKNTGNDYTVGLPTDAGTYEITANLPEQTNYKAAFSQPITLTINPVDPIISTPQAEELTYNGGAQKLVTPGTVRDGAVILFALGKPGEDGEIIVSDYSDAIPTGINAGKYIVYYKVEKTRNFNGVTAQEIPNVEIRRKLLTDPVVELEYESYQYDGGEIQPKVTAVRDPDTREVLPDYEYTVTYSNNISAAKKTDANPPTVTVKDTGGGNYEFDDVKTFFTITPKDQDGLTIIGQPGAVSYGDVFPLSTSGGSGNGAVTWKITVGGQFATVEEKSGLVTVTGVGEVTVQATRAGDDYKDATAEWTFTSAKKHVTATVTAENKTYDGSSAATVKAEVKEGVVSGDTIAITVTGTFSSASAGTGKTVTVDTVKINGAAAAAGDFDTEKYVITIPGTTTADIYKAEVTVTAPTPVETLTYTGNNQALVTEGSVSGVSGGATPPSMEYSLYSDGPWSTTIPQRTDAGSYDVWYRTQETDNYSGTAAKKVVVTIRPKTVEVTNANATLTPAGGDTYYIYDGSEKKPAVTVVDGSVTISPDEYTVTYSNHVNAGTATVTITDRTGGNYAVSGTATFTISKGQAVLTGTPQAVAGLTYNGLDQDLVTVGTVTGGHLVYSLTVTGTYTAAIPRKANADTYTVYYKVEGDNNHTGIETASVVHVTIQPKTVSSPEITLNLTVTADYTGYTGVYNGSPQKPKVSSVKDNGVEIPSTEYTVSYSNNINAGTATVHITDISGGNYTVNGSADFEIGKAPAAFTANPTGASGLVYNGKAQALITAGTAVGGTAVYKLEGGEYSPEIPTGTARGLYKISAKVQGDANHEDSDEITPPVEVTIGVNVVANPTVELSQTSFQYNGNEQKPTITVKDDKGNVIPENEYTVSYLLVTDDGDAAAGSTVSAGTYKIKIASKADSNYQFTEDTHKFTITPADQTALTITGKPDVVYYGSMIQLSTTGGSGNGTVEWSVVSGSAIHKGGGQFQITGTGSIKVKAARTSASGNYDLAEDTWEFYAYPKPVTVAVTAADKEYDGNTDAVLSVAVPVDGIEITVNVHGTFDSKDAGTNKKVTYTINAGDVTVEGGNKDNYEIAYPLTGTTTASITPKKANEPEVIYKSDGTLIIKITDADGSVVPDSEYTYSTSIMDGSGTVTITLKGNYIFADGTQKREIPVTAEEDDDPGEDPEVVPGGDGSGTGGGASTPEPAPTVQTTVRDGTASTVVSDAAGNELVNKAVANKSENVVIKPEITGNVTKAEVSLPASMVSRIGRETDASLTVSTPIADVTIPNGALDALSGARGTVSVAAEQVDNTVVLTLTANGRDVRTLPGGLTLTVPTEDAGPGTVAVLVYEDGTREIIRKSVAASSGVRIPLDGSATVEIVDNSKEFKDVPAESWAADAVAFASAHEMFNGTSETTFSPELSMSRAMLATVLYNLESNPDTAFNSAFADVGGDTWYAESVSWAADRGIVTGYGDGSFGAGDSITREQLAVMLWRYAGSPTGGGQTLDFTDADQASGYAMEALAWAAANGILNGYGNGRIDPTGLATRAQAAQMLKNFMENT